MASHLNSRKNCGIWDHSDVDAEYVQARLEGMRPYVWESLLGFAKQAMEHHSFKSLRRSRRRRQKFGTDNLDVDLTTLGA